MEFQTSKLRLGTCNSWLHICDLKLEIVDVKFSNKKLKFQILDFRRTISRIQTCDSQLVIWNWRFEIWIFQIAICDVEFDSWNWNWKIEIWDMRLKFWHLRRAICALKFPIRKLKFKNQNAQLRVHAIARAAIVRARAIARVIWLQNEKSKSKLSPNTIVGSKPPEIQVNQLNMLIC